MKATAHDRIIYSAEVRKKLGDISESTLYNWIKHGFPGGFAPIPGAKLRWRESTVDRWIADQETKAAAGEAA